MKYRVAKEELEMFIEVKGCEELGNLTMLSFICNQGPKEKYARTCTEILRLMRI